MALSILWENIQAIEIGKTFKQEKEKTSTQTPKQQVHLQARATLNSLHHSRVIKQQAATNSSPLRPAR